MLRQPTVQEDWTKYFVNGTECKREDIYQTILDKHFYDGEVRLQKKHYHHEEQTSLPLGFSFPGLTNTSTSSSSENHSASLTLNTKKFVAKFDPKGEEYKTQIDKMIDALDMFYLAQINFGEHAENMQIVMRQCLSFFSEHTLDPKAPYNSIMIDYTSGIFVLLTSLLANYLSGHSHANTKGDIRIPTLDFSAPNLKEPYNEDWDDKKKSKYLGTFLTAIDKKLASVRHAWLSDPLYRDKSSRQQIENLFDEFNTTIVALHARKKSQDEALHLTSGFKLGSLFHRHSHREHSSEMNNDNSLRK